MKFFSFDADSISLNEDTVFEEDCENGFLMTVTFCCSDATPFSKDRPEWPVMASEGGILICGRRKYDPEATLRRAKEEWIGDSMVDGPEKDAEAWRLINERLDRMKAFFDQKWTMLHAEIILSHPLLGEISQDFVHPLPSDDIDLIINTLNEKATLLWDKAHRPSSLKQIIARIEEQHLCLNKLKESLDKTACSLL